MLCGGERLNVPTLAFEILDAIVMIVFTLIAGHIFIASISTGHALLNKENVSSSIGWIGLIWLSPVLGACLYYAFGINRVARRAIKRIDPGQAQMGERDGENTHSPPMQLEQMTVLSNVGQEMTGHKLLPGNRVDVLENGDAAYPAMIAKIESAKHSICLAAYIFRSDQVGHQFADALIAAHRRGVQVRVLVDAIGSGFFMPRVMRRLKASGLNAARFMFDRHPWSMAFLNLRNHKKLLLIDGRQAYVGGLNLGAENTTRFFGTQRIDDIHFGIAGPVVAQLMQDFARDWEFATHEKLIGPDWWPHIDHQGNCVCRAVTSGPDEDTGKIETLFAVALGVARKRVRIVTPYFLPDQRLSEAIRLAVLRGVEVEVVVPEKSDHLIIDWAMRGHFSFLAGTGVKLHLSAAPFDHAKLVTMDRQWCGLGSPNWDVRSLRLNFELLVECYSSNLVETIDQLIDQKLRVSRPLLRSELSMQWLPVKLRNAGARLFLPYL